MIDISKMFQKRFGNVEGYKDSVIYTEVLGNRVYKTSQNPVYRFKTPLDEGKSDNSMNLELRIPKIPFKYYLMALDFYREIHAQHGTEACVLFYWNKDNVEIPADLLEKYGKGIIQDGQLIVIAPKQYASAGLSSIVETIDVNGTPTKVLTEMVKWLEDNTVCVLETHSHHTMGAFWSSTDDANEQHSKIRMFSVFGKITSTQNVLTRIHFLGKFYDLDRTDIFEFPAMKVIATVGTEDYNFAIPNIANEKVYTGPFEKCDTFPMGWLEMVSVPKPLFSSSIGYNSRFNGKPSGLNNIINNENNTRGRGKTVVNSEYGWLVDDEDDDSLTEEVLDERELLERLAQEGIEVDDYLNDTYIDDMKDFDLDDDFVDSKKSVMEMTDAEFKKHINGI